MENVPGVFWAHSSEETNLQENEHKVMDGKTLLNDGSRGKDMRQHRPLILNELQRSVAALACCDLFS